MAPEGPAATGHPAPAGRPVLFTVGHGTLGADELAAVLERAGVRAVVDVRIAPGSRRNPHLARAQLERWLPERGVTYRWERRLGGFRRAPAGSPDVALRNASFRGYAAHMRTGEFRAAIELLLAGVAVEATTVMCSETLWWRCHRRLVADYALVVHGVEVCHLLPGAPPAPHRPTEGVRADGEWLFYDS